MVNAIIMGELTVIMRLCIVFASVIVLIFITAVYINHLIYFHELWFVSLGLVRNMKIFCSEDLFWFQRYWRRDIFHENFRLHYQKFYGRHTELVHKLDTSCVTYVEGLFINCDICLASSWFKHILFLPI